MTFSLGVLFLSLQNGGKNVYFLSVLENMQDVCGDHSSFSYKTLCVCEFALTTSSQLKFLG